MFVGFIGNGDDDGAHLLVEAFTVTDGPLGRKKVGEARCDIFPCNFTVNVDTDYEELMYDTQDVRFLLYFRDVLVICSVL